MWNKIQKWAKDEKTVCVDMDGTILEYDHYEKNKFGNPIDGVVNKLKELKDSGDVKLVLSTARSKDEKPALIEHLKENDLFDMFDDIQVGVKPIAVAYLDDKAVNVLSDDWMDKLNKMME